MNTAVKNEIVDAIRELNSNLNYKLAFNQKEKAQKLIYKRLIKEYTKKCKELEIKGLGPYHQESLVTDVKLRLLKAIDNSSLCFYTDKLQLFRFYCLPCSCGDDVQSLEDAVTDVESQNYKNNFDKNFFVSNTKTLYQDSLELRLEILENKLALCLDKLDEFVSKFTKD